MSSPSLYDVDSDENNPECDTSIMKKISMPISLRHFCLVQISKQIWKQADISRVLEETINDDQNWYLCYCNPRLLSSTKKTLSKLINPKIRALNLPNVVKKDLRFVIGEMGAILISWLHRICEVGRMASTDHSLKYYIKHICWTDNGLIDSSATLRSLYRSGDIKIDGVILSQLCYHCVSDCIKECMKYYKSVAYRSYYSDYVEYWAIHYGASQRRLTRFLSYDATGQNTNYITMTNEENMLLKSIKHTNYSGMKYFWQQLSTSERREISEELFRNLSDPFSSRRRSIDYNITVTHDGVNQIEPLIFFLWHFTDYNTERLMKRFGLLISTTWPYQAMFPAVLEYYGDNGTLKLGDTIHLIEEQIVKGIRTQTRITGHDERYHEILSELVKSGLVYFERNMFVQWAITNLVLETYKTEPARKLFLDLLICLFEIGEIETLAFLEQIDMYCAPEAGRAFYRELVLRIRRDFIQKSHKKWYKDAWKLLRSVWRR